MHDAPAPARPIGRAMSDPLDSLRDLISELVRAEVARQLAAAPAPAELLDSTAEAATYAKVAPRTIRRWIDEGRLTPLRAGRELRIRRADLDALLRSGTRRKPSGRSAEELARSLRGGRL